MLHLARETGRPITDAWMGQVLGQHRRSLNAAFVRAQSACLVSRMGHLGVGAREAVARRKVAAEQEHRLRREEEVYFAVHVRGRGRWTLDWAVVATKFSITTKFSDIWLSLFWLIVYRFSLTNKN